MIDLQDTIIASFLINSIPAAIKFTVFTYFIGYIIHLLGKGVQGMWVFIARPNKDFSKAEWVLKSSDKEENYIDKDKTITLPTIKDDSKRPIDIDYQMGEEIKLP